MVPRRRIVWCLAAIGATVLFGYLGYKRTLNGNGDWVLFEVGARSLVHYHHNNLYGGNRWHLYIENADLQIGPPAFWAIAIFEGLKFRTIYALFGFVMPALGLLAVGSATLTGAATRTVRLASRFWVEAAFAAAAVCVAAVWAFDSNSAKHLDDAMALSFAATAAMLIARQRPWWLAGILLGTAAATKPWAIILAPMLLGLPRRDLARTTLVTILAAAFWWAPFVISAPSTIQALGHFPVVTQPGSVLQLIGFDGHVERWLRPVQFIVGLGVGAFVAFRRTWLAAPLAALATRVLTDPYAFGYYGLGPLLFAYLLDSANGGWRGLPVWTAYTAGIEFLLPYTGVGATWVAVGKLVWGLSTLALILRPRVDVPGEQEAAEDLAAGPAAEGPAPA
ncbi:MAG TPA: hypothetical protein VHE57_11945 [Mycobacteriales bacterium]|nr:hypothetical protein [Mycobacteriales bacterium]